MGHEIQVSGSHTGRALAQHDEILRNHYKKSRFNGTTLTTDMEWNVVGHSCFCTCYEKPGV